MTEKTPRHPRTWVFWMVVASLLLTVLLMGTRLFAPRQHTVSFWWLVFGMPQVSIALLAAVLCWAPGSRPRGFRLSIGISVLNGNGLIAALLFLKWQPAVIGAITIIVLKFWPKEKLVVEQTTPGRVQG